MRVESQTLVAGARTPFRIPGRFFLLIQAGAGLDVEFRRNKSLLREKATDVVAGYKSFPGDWADPDDNTFDEFVLTSATGQTITFGVSESAGDYSFLLALVKIEQPDTLLGTADATVGVAVSTVLASNADRRFVHFRALKANTASIRLAQVGGAAVATGAYLDAGDAITFETTAAFEAISAVAGQLLSILEETKP